MHRCDAASQGRQVEPPTREPSAAVAIQTRSPLDEVLREGARPMLLEAVEQEHAA